MEYLSVKEFAKRAGISPQAVYQRIDKDLKRFVKIHSGKKTISSAALELFLNNGNKLIENFKASDNPKVDVSEKVIQSLLKQLEKKDEQIAAKDRQIAEKDSQLKDLTLALINEQKSAQQAHALHAGTINQINLQGENQQAHALHSAANNQVNVQEKKRSWINYFKKRGAKEQDG